MNPLFGDLEALGKLLRPRKRLALTGTRALCCGRGHDNVTDDLLLYQAAATFDRIVVTREVNLHRRGGQLAEDVTTVASEDLMEEPAPS